MSRGIALLLLCVVAALAATANLGAAPLGPRLQWEETSGLDGAYVLCLATTNAGTLLAGAENGGLFRSTDAGASWERVEEGLSWPCCNYNIQSLAVSDWAIYAGTWGGGVRLSTDDGTSWFERGAIPGDGYPIVASIVTCRYGNRAYAGGNFGVARTDDDGASWTQVNDGLPPAHWVRALALRGTTLYAILDAGAYRLEPNAPSWVPSNDGLPDTGSLWSFCPTADALFLSTFEGGVFHLDCDDMAWQAMNAELWDDNVTSILELDRTLLAGTMGSGLFRWDRLQRLWVQESGGLWNRDIRATGRHGLRALAGTFGGGVFARDPDSGEWTHSSAGLRAPLITSLEHDGLYLYAGQNGGGVWRSPDQGATWLEPAGWIEDPYIHDLGRDALGIYAACWSGVWRSTDHGQSWSLTGPANESVRSLDTWDGVLYAGTWGGRVHASTNGGVDWTEVGSGLPGQRIESVARFGAALYAATGGSGVYRLPDGATTWTAVNSGLSDLSIPCLAVSGGLLYAGTEGAGVFRWNHSGQQWEPAGQDFETVFCLADTGTQLLAGTWGGVWAAPSGTTEWSNESSGLKDWLPVRALLPAGAGIFAGLSGGGVWKTGNTGAAPDAPLALPEGTLFVRPNPFARGAEIVFALERDSRVALTVHDAAGRRVASIEDGTLPAGEHRRAWDGRLDGGRSAPAGSYFVRLRTGDREMTERVVRLR